MPVKNENALKNKSEWRLHRQHQRDWNKRVVIVQTIRGAMWTTDGSVATIERIWADTIYRVG